MSEIMYSFKTLLLAGIIFFLEANIVLSQNVDLKIDSIINNKFVIGNNLVKVRLINNSKLSINSIQLSYSVNQKDTIKENWNGILNAKDTLIYEFAQHYEILNGKGYKLEILALPVSLTDTSSGNNKINAQYNLPMAGHYNLGIGSNDYTTFEQISTDLGNCKRADTIFFDIIPGSFDNIISIYAPIAANSNQNWVVFQNPTGNINDLSLKLKQIKGAFIKLQHLTIYSYAYTTSSSNGFGINLEGNNLILNHNTFIGSTAYENRIGISLANADSIKIKNCNFKNFNIAIQYQITISYPYSYPWTANQGFHYIEKSVFDSCNYGIYILADYWENKKYVWNNIFKNCNTPIYKYSSYGWYLDIGYNKIYNSKYDGIYMYASLENSSIHHNYIKSKGFCINLSGGIVAAGGMRTINNIDISNNMLISELQGMIIGGGKTIKYDGPALYLTNVQETKIINNSFYGGYNFNDNGKDIYLINNHFFSKTLLYVSEYGFSTFFPCKGYDNNYYADNDSILSYGAGNKISSIKDFLIASSNYLKNGKNEYPFFKNSRFDLHSNSYILNNAGKYDSIAYNDFDKELRHYPTCDIGADEYDVINYKIDLILDSILVTDRVCPGKKEIKINVRNNSLDTLYAFYANFLSPDTSGRKAFFDLKVAPGATIKNLSLFYQKFYSNDTVPMKVWVSFPNGGLDSINFNDTLTKKIITQHSIEIGNKLNICKGNSIKLYDPAPFISYLWNDKTTQPYLFANKENKYWVDAIDSLGCHSSDTAYLSFYKPFYAKLAKDTSICNNDSLLLTVDKNITNYIWNTNSTNSSIIVKKAGIYSYTGNDINGCTIIPDTIKIGLNPIYSEANYYNVCEGDSILVNHKYYKTSGIYFDTLITKCGCDSVLVNHISKLQSSNSVINISACKNYLSPSGHYTWTANGIYSDTIPNFMGCDSIITINLIVTKVDTLIYQINNTLSANASNASYQWLNCNANCAKISGAINKTYTPTASGNYAVEINQNGCIDTSRSILVVLTGIIYNTFYKDIIVFPNPTSGAIHINLFETYNNIEIEVRNLFGQLIQFKKFERTESLLLDFDVPNGIYLITIKNDKNQKVIIKAIKK